MNMLISQCESVCVMCWNQEVQGLLQMRWRCARASLTPCTGAWTPHSPSIAHVGLFLYLVHIFDLSGIAKRHRRAIAKCLVGTKHICLPVHPYSLSFDLTHGPYAPTIVSGGKCLYSPNYPHATGIIPLTSPSPFMQMRTISSMPHIPFISLSGFAPHIILHS